MENLPDWLVERGLMYNLKKIKVVWVVGLWSLEMRRRGQGLYLEDEYREGRTHIDIVE